MLQWYCHKNLGAQIELVNFDNYPNWFVTLKFDSSVVVVDDSGEIEIAISQSLLVWCSERNNTPFYRKIQNEIPSDVVMLISKFG